MKFTYGNLTFSTKYIYIVFVILIFLTDLMFFELIIGGPKEERPPFPTPEKYLAVVALSVPIFFINRFSPFIQRLVILAYGYFFVLVIESYLFYGSFFIYPHVFSKIMELFMVFFAFLLFKKPVKNQFSHIVFIITLGCFLNLIIFKTHLLNLGAFVNTDRAINADSTYLMMIPCLYFFNRYFFKGQIKYLALFFVTIALLLFLQHRTVWVTLTFSLFLNVLLLKYKSRTKISLTSLVIFTVVPILIAVTASTFIFIEKPEVIEQFVNRLSDIENLQAENSTSSWRIQQIESYLPFIKQNIFLGMRFSGFELPIQFYHQEADIPLFTEGTGHHFHNMYLDKLFYFGIVGLILIITPLFYTMVIFFKRNNLSPSQITLLSFLASGVVYGISYNWSFYFYAIIGIAMAFANRQISEEPDMDNVHQDIEEKMVRVNQVPTPHQLIV